MNMILSTQLKERLADLFTMAGNCHLPGVGFTITGVYDLAIKELEAVPVDLHLGQPPVERAVTWPTRPLPELPVDLGRSE
jgi:hypothetical protein